MKFIEEKAMPFAAKIGSQRHLVAIRDAFIVVMPMTIVGSIAVLINNIHLLFGPNGFNTVEVQTVYANVIASTGIQEIMNAINKGTINMMSLLLILALGYQMAKQMHGDPIATPVVSLATYLSLVPGVQTLKQPHAIASDVTAIEILKTDIANAGIAAEKLDSNGLFLAMILTFIVSEIFIRLSKKDKLRITLLDGVPPAVAGSFTVLLPSVITVTLVVGAGILIQKLVGMDLWKIITTVIQTPLTNITENVFTAAFIPFIMLALWCFGLHGANIVGAITQPIFTPMLLENTAAYQQGILPPNVINGTGMFYALGGSGCTIGLIIAVFLVEKVSAEKQICRLSIAPGIFKINEPIIFGIPIVINPIYMIPFVMGPVICLVISYYLMLTNIIERVCLSAPWVTPPILKQFFATGGGIRAAIWAAVEIVLLTAIWIPFVLISNKQNENAVEQ